MSWFKKKNYQKVALTEIQNRIRGFLFDAAIEDPVELAATVGLSEISDEIIEMEEQQSARRVAKLVGLVPIMYICSHIFSESLVTYQAAQIPEEIMEQLPEEAFALSASYIEKVSFSSMMGMLSQLVDMGLITISAKYKGAEYE